MDSADALAFDGADAHIARLAPLASNTVLDDIEVGTVLRAIADGDCLPGHRDTALLVGYDATEVVLEDVRVTGDCHGDGLLRDRGLELHHRVLWQFAVVSDANLAVSRLNTVVIPAVVRISGRGSEITITLQVLVAVGLTAASTASIQRAVDALLLGELEQLTIRDEV